MEAIQRTVRLRIAQTVPIQTQPTRRLSQREMCCRPPGVQMLPEAIRNQVFPLINRSQPSNESIEAMKDHLKRFGLWHAKADCLDDVNIELPRLLGANIEEHFDSIGKRFSMLYLDALKELTSATVPIIPSKFAFLEGWVRYTVDGHAFEKVEAPEGDALVFDVETVVVEGGLPVMAVALSNKSWFSWCSTAIVGGRDHRVERVTPNLLIPLGTVDRETIVVGHAVGFDRSFLKEEYDARQSKRRFLDTLSMHVCVSGQATSQKMMTSVLKKWNDHTKNSTMKPVSIGDIFKWGKVSALNNLADVYQLYCQAELSKSARQTFITGTSAEIRADFQQLMNYCFSDVKATRDVLAKLLPLFVKRFPHPVSFFGLTESLTAYLPVSENWNRYLSRAEAVYNDTNAEIQHILNMLANKACRMHQDGSWRNDPWLWDLDWSTQNLKCKQKASRSVDLSEATNNLSPKQSDMKREYPKWYREVCAKLLENGLGLSNEEFGTWKIPVRGRCIPKLLKLMWNGYPLHFHEEYGWGYLVPHNKPGDESHNRDSTGFPLKEYTLIVNAARARSTTYSKFASIQPVEEILDLDDLSKLSSYNDWETMRKTFKKHFIPDLQRKSGKNEIFYDHLERIKDWKTMKSISSHCESEKNDLSVKNSSGMNTEANIDIGISGVLFRRLPHKYGVNYNVGTPLSVHFIEKYQGNLLRSWDDDNADRLLELMKQTIHWSTVRERLQQQMFVWTSENEGVVLPRLIPAGTINRRPMEKMWLSGCHEITYRIGSEHRTLVHAPQGMHFVRARFDSLEFWIASILGDSAFQGVHASTAFGWATVQGQEVSGTDVHSRTAAVLNCSLDHAKVIDFARIYGAEKAILASIFRTFNPSLTKKEASDRCERLLRVTKGVRCAATELDQMFFNKSKNPLSCPQRWFAGTESHAYNALNQIALGKIPRTPFLLAQITRALEPAAVGSCYMKARQTWIIQSSAMDYLHMMLASMRDLFDRFQIDGRLVVASHDEISYMVRSKDRFRAVLAMHISNLFVRSMCASRLGIHDLPFSVAFLDAVSVDKTLRKDVTNDCVTPSNAEGLQKNYGVPLGEVIDIYTAIKQTAGGKLTV